MDIISIRFMNERYAKKRFGQNFLNDKTIVEKISNVIDINNKKIIEIGPGKGSLTSFLVRKAKKVVAFEIDYNLVDLLKCDFNDDNLEIINSDFLKEDLSKYKGFHIVANIPYNISTDIIFKILENYEKFENVVLLVQKEFAKRVCANVNSSDYSKLSPSVKLFYDAFYCFDVSNECFWPKPKVTSAVIHLKRSKQKYDVDYWDFLSFIKTCFGMRRKTLWNNIKKYKNITKEKFDYICDHLKINKLVRPEEISFEQYIEMYKLI